MRPPKGEQFWDAVTNDYWDAALRMDRAAIAQMSEALSHMRMSWGTPTPDDIAPTREVREAAAKRATFWGCTFDLVTDGLVDVVPYADPDEVKVNDLVIVTQGENAGHVAVVEETQFVSSPPSIARLLHGGSHARLRRIWPVKWRGPASSYWVPEHRFDTFAELRPKVPEFPSSEAADWWMHDARKVTVGQEAGFTINTRTYMDEKPWRDRYEEHEYTGTITEITEFDMAYWYRYRPLAKGKFRILHFDDDMNPLLTWVEEIVRL